MKKKTIFALFSVFFCILFISALDIDEEEDQLSASYLSKRYALTELQNLIDKTTDFYHAIETKDLDNIQSLFGQLRIQYKKVEFYLESYESEYIKYLNGEPTSWISFDTGNLEAINPHGLQYIEELIYADSVDYKQLKFETGFFYSELMKYKSITEVNPTSDASIFLGIKYSLIRIEALSLPAYDCQITKQISPEINSSLDAISSVLHLYKSTNKDKDVTNDIEMALKTIQSAQKYLEPQKGKFLGFEEVDKLMFIKKYLQPLNSHIVDIFEKLKVEQPILMRIFKFITQINGKSKNIYNPDFLNILAKGEKGYYEIEKYEKLDPKVVALGEKLFFDNRLSHDNIFSCQSCHEPKLAFTDGLKTAKTNQVGVFQTRNSPTIVYSAYDERFFYDLRSYSVEDQSRQVVHNPKEFNTTYTEIVSKLIQDSTLVQEFTEVFPKDWKKPIKESTIRKALGQYVRSLATFNSEFDAYMRGEIKDIAPEVKRGFNLFMGKANCGTCHFAPIYSGLLPPLYGETESDVVGLLEKYDTIHPTLSLDSGRYNTQKNPVYIGSIKTTTVRNIALTAPYMSNGGFPDLESVMDFYNRGGGAGMGLHVPNQTLDSQPLNLTKDEISDIIAFMKSLTDRQFLKMQ
ncbi:MAG: hypothetical protein M9887_05675 [Chitinophagales bacterium]|nr:hypothetical protein [Chitinophagales bacterium]